MASLPDQATPSRVRTGAPFLRSFTAPVQTLNAQHQETNAQGAVTLFAHASAKIVAFSTLANIHGSRHSSVSNGKIQFQEEAAGALAWASPTETTLAVGPLRIYRVPGSVAFLHSGNTLHPILPKSQCWCVDGQSKFVLRIRPHNFYRIELPCESGKEKEQVKDLERVLRIVLQYEQTPCPFKRGFAVDIPTTPEVIKVPWTPKKSQGKPRGDTDGSHMEDLGDLNFHMANAKRQTKPFVEYTTEQVVVFNLNKVTAEKVKDFPLEAEGAVITDDGADEDSTSLGQKSSYTDLFKQAPEDNVTRGNTPLRPKLTLAGRTVTAPPHLSLTASPPSGASKAAPSFSYINEEIFDHSAQATAGLGQKMPTSDGAANEAEDPFATLRPLSPKLSKPLTVDGTDGSLCAVATQKYTLSTPETLCDEGSHGFPARQNNVAASSSLASALDQVEIRTGLTKSKPPPSLRVRKNFQQRRSHPAPSSAKRKIYHTRTPSQEDQQVDGYQITTAFLQRTYALLISPPGELLALMLRIAARIANGALQGSAFVLTEGGERVPCTWDFSSDASSSRRGSPSASSEDSWWDEDVDDYGLSLTKPSSGSSAASRTKAALRAWDVE